MASLLSLHSLKVALKNLLSGRSPTLWTTKEQNKPNLTETWGEWDRERSDGAKTRKIKSGRKFVSKKKRK